MTNETELKDAHIEHIQCLECQVIHAIETGELINFDSKRKEDCKYLQRSSEIKRSYYQRWFSVAFFFTAVGISLIITYVSLMSLNFWPVLFDGVVIALIGIGVIKIYAKPRFDRCQEIILNAEKEIHFEDWEKKK